MNQSLIQLQKISEKDSRTIIGLMSGTSLDGLDIALCTITGAGSHTKITLEKFVTIDYTKDQKKLLKKISSVETVGLKDLCYMHTHLAADHADMISRALKKWSVSGKEVDCIASHGQTIYHYPARDQKRSGQPLNTTFQIGDGDQIAAGTGIMTISDFRQKHTAHGGEGAPMAALVDRLLFGDAQKPRILLNIGGIANYTWLPAADKTGAQPFTTDTGPGNTLIDNVVQHYFNMPFDRDAKIAKSGRVLDEVLQPLLSDPWFKESSSKSTGPEYFNIGWIRQTLEDDEMRFDQISPEDMVATVTELSAVSIAVNMAACVPDVKKCGIYASGGGAHNPVLMKRLRDLLPGTELMNFSELGVDPDAKEAVIFAVLANEMLAGEGFPMETKSGVKKVKFGKISFPE